MKDILKTIGLIFTVAMLIYAVGYTVPKILEIERPVETQIRVDTVITEKRDTIILTNIKPYTEIKYKKVVDTLKTIDSVFVPVEVPLSVQKYEADTLSNDGTKVHYRASISGYRQSLDTLWFDVERHDRIITKEVTKWKNRKWSVSPSIGAGYGMINRKLDIWIGVSANYNF